MLQSKRLDVLVLHEKFVEVSYHGGKNQKDGVFCHEGLRQMVPTNVGGSFGIKLFCFKKLMVKIYNIVRIGI